MAEYGAGVPALQTERLILDGCVEADLEPMARLFGDVRVMRHIGGAALDRKEVFRRLLRYRGAWPVLGYGMWVWRSRADRRYLGHGGFFREERGFAAPYCRMPEAGWCLLPEAEGQGFAREAMTAAVGWLDGAGWSASLCLIDAANARSLRLAGRLGYEEAPDAALRDDTARVLVRRQGCP